MGYDRRLRCYLVPVDEIATWGRGEKRQIRRAWPPDAEVVGGEFDAGRHAFIFTVRSRMFEPLPPGQVIPLYDGPTSIPE